MNKLASDLTDIADAIYHHNGGTVDDSSYVSLYGIANEIEELVAENANLRELVQDMWFWGYEGHMNSKSQDWQIKHIDGVLDRMRELRVEVDG